MTVTQKKLRVGTRGSKLALTQTETVCAAIRAAHPGLEVETIIIKASGDWKPAQGEVRLSEHAGGKGQFVKEIEDALLAGSIDIGVHSLKDVPTFLPDGLVLDHFMQRADARDVFISNIAHTLDTLPAGSVVGTSSVRRQAIILNRCPDLKVVTFRGNVDTRLEKLNAGQVDAIILAASGLHRLGRESVISSYLEPDVMLPAVGQGVLAIETRADDAATHAILDAVTDVRTRLTCVAERALLEAMNGSCGTPIGSYAAFENDGTLRLRGLFSSADGRDMFTAEETAAITDVAAAYAMGQRVGKNLLAQIPETVLLALAS